MATGKILIGGKVRSVNSMVGDVVLAKTDIGLGNVDNVQQYSASNPPPYPVTSVNTQTGAVTLTKSDIGLGNVDNIQQYSVSNPPPYPVTSVNGQTGAVTVQAGGIDFYGGTGGVAAVSREAGIGQVTDDNRFYYLLTADKKYIMVWGSFTIAFSTTGDYTAIRIGTNVTLDVESSTYSYYGCAANLVDTYGRIKVNASRKSNWVRIASSTPSYNYLRLAIDDPQETGTMTVMVNPTVLQVKK